MATDNVLVHDEALKGKYVALTDDDNHTVMGSSRDPGKALKEAVEGGCTDAVLLYVPADNEGAFVYYGQDMNAC